MSKLKQPFIAAWEAERTPIRYYNFSAYPSVTKIRNCQEVDDGVFLWNQDVAGKVYSEWHPPSNKHAFRPILFFPREFVSDIEIVSGHYRLQVNILKYDFKITMEPWAIVKLAREGIIEKGLIRDVDCLVNKQNHLITVDPQ